MRLVEFLSSNKANLIPQSLIPQRVRVIELHDQATQASLDTKGYYKLHTNLAQSPQADSLGFRRNNLRNSIRVGEASTTGKSKVSYRSSSSLDVFLAENTYFYPQQRHILHAHSESIEPSPRAHRDLQSNAVSHYTSKVIMTTRSTFMFFILLITYSKLQETCLTKPSV